MGAAQVIISTNKIKKVIPLVLIMLCSFFVSPFTTVYAVEEDDEIIDVETLTDDDFSTLFIEYECDTLVTGDDVSFYIPSALYEEIPNFYVMSGNYGEKYIWFVPEYEIRNGRFTYKVGYRLYSSSGYNSFSLGSKPELYIYDDARVGVELDEILYSNFDILDTSGAVVYEANVFVTQPTRYISFSTGYDDIVIDSVKTNEFGKLDSLPVPQTSPQGYIFNGWYLEETFDTQVTEDTIFDSDTTLYAKWEADPVLDTPSNLLISETNDVLYFISAQLSFFMLVIILIYVYKFFRIFF